MILFRKKPAFGINRPRTTSQPAPPHPASDTPEFKEQFDAIAFEIEEVLACRPDVQITDMNEAEFQITYSDKTKHKENTILFGDWYHDLFMDIKMMVPFTEQIPMTLLTDEDFEEDEE